jgi:spore coat polysaccharide biosynthesis predicted glycosyltransferase SpsG
VGGKYGLGHFMRCLSIAQGLQKRNLGKVLFLLNSEMKDNAFLARFNVPIEFNEDENKVLSSFKPTAIIIDINYLERDKVIFYRKWAPVVNLAPRGLTKFYADVTFNRMRGLDMPAPSDAHNFIHFRGPEYAIVGQQFISVRKRLDQISGKWQPRKVIVSMGGIDQINMTKAVLDEIVDMSEEIEINLILSPLYKYNDQIEELTAIGRVKTVVDPIDVAQEIVKASIGIFGMGVVTYEALSIGVPSINIGPSSFHSIVGEELSSKGIILYAGDFDNNKKFDLKTQLSKLIFQDELIESMRQKGRELVDGKGTERIVDKMFELFG